MTMNAGAAVAAVAMDRSDLEFIAILVAAGSE
jgi:hypothetical protein